MKNTLLVLVVTIAATLFSSAKLFSQAPPQGINYQAVARDASGAELQNTPLTVRIGIYSDPSATVLAYEETHAVTTNAFGLFTAVIGQGTQTSPSAFNTILWANSAHYLKVEINGGSGFTDMGTTQLMSVPYALYAGSSAGGPTGPQGATGAQGPIGPTGAQGIAGATGAQGNAGLQGATGANGINGSTGATGATGSGIHCWDLNGDNINDLSEDVNSDGSWNSLDCIGATGAVGATGSAGTNGATGATGTNGTNGIDGLECWDTNGNNVNDPSEDINLDGFWNSLDCQGATGATGIAGNIGATGPAGPSGVNGTNGTNGATGATGPSGANGAVGATGVTGPSGANGAVGVTGVAGATGANGINGATGPTGAIGAAGPSGINGTNGATGATGPTGAIGAAGPSGSNGTNGATGPTGAIGAAGPSGSNGTNGATGPTGPSGAIGAAGPSGTNGSNGAAGPTGPSGANGAAGPTGPSGANGATGATGPLIAGTAGQTLYHDGANWVATSNLYNNGTNVGVSIVPSLAKFEVGAAINNTVGMFGTNARGIALMQQDARLGFNMYEGAAGNLLSMGAGRTGLISLNSTADAMIFSMSNGITGSPSTIVTMTERMRIVAANGYVGIGTNNPTRKLHILETVSANQPMTQFEFTTSSAVSTLPNAAIYGEVIGSGAGNVQGGYFFSRTTNASATTVGVFGQARSSSVRNSGVYGHVPTTGGVGVSVGVEGLAESTNGSFNYGLYGSGVAATSGSSSAYGVFGMAGNGINTNATSYGVYGSAPGSFGTRWSGWFEEGNFYVKNPSGFGTSILPGATQIAIHTGGTGNYHLRLTTTITGVTAGDGFVMGQASGGGEMLFNQYETSNVYFQYQSSNIFQYNGVGVGIKTTTSPVEALEVNGNVELQTAINEYKYGTARTRYINLHGSAFEAYTASATTASTQAFTSGSSRSVTGGTLGTDYMLIAPVVLPHGAVITGFELYAWDNSNVYEMTGELCRETIGATAVTVIASTATGTAAVNASMTLYSGVGTHTVDNTTFVYLVRVKMEEGLGSPTDLRLGYVRVIYTVTKAE